MRQAARVTLGPETRELLKSPSTTPPTEFHRFVLSIAELTRLDSIGLGLLVRFAARLRQRGGDIRLAEPPAFVVKLLELTQLSSIVRCFPTEDEAISRRFLRQSPSGTARPSRSQRPAHVLFVDESPELCVFVGNASCGRSR